MTWVTQKQKEMLILVFTWLGIALGSFVVVSSLVAATAYAYEVSYRGKFFRGVEVAGVSLDGLTREQARTRLEQLLAKTYGEGYTFVLEGNTETLPAIRASLDDPDLSQDLISFDLEKTLDDAAKLGHEGDLLEQQAKRLRLLLRSQNVPVEHAIQEPIVHESLRTAFNDQLILAKDAELTINATTTDPGYEIVVTDEQIGKEFNEASALKQLSEQASQLAFHPITLDVIRIEPTVRKGDLEPLRDQAPALLEHAPFAIRYVRSRWTISEETLASWLGAVQGENGLKLGIVPERMVKTLTELGGNLIREPVNGRLVLGEGMVVKEFVEPVAGQRVDTEKTIENIHTLWGNDSKGEADLALETIEPSIEGPDAERLGIREVLGIGRSDYSGSPANRRYNIAYGASKMNGVIVAPGKEFSQLASLGPVDGAHGWRPELVIKGNETIPEYGGGLCQIGTTSFRAALAAGMQITERRNHSYRVRYYEPAGTDATIYEPSPDFRFKNDTANYIMITSRTVGDEVVTTIWGTRDGRVAEQTKPIVYNITSPPPTKLIETTDLAPGVKKCTESAHAGASAKFDYKVSYADGSVHEETFYSLYRPWQAVCLIGVENMSTEPTPPAESPPPST